MSEVITIFREQILHQIKLSCQIPAVIESILTREIIRRAAGEAGIKAGPKELQQAADRLRLISNLKSADATWSWLQKHNLSLDDFGEMVEANVLSSKLAQHLFADKVEPFFIEKQMDYTQVVMYEVVLDDEDLAMEIFYKLGEGEVSFHEVAHQLILDTEQRHSGDYRNVLCCQDLKPEISAAVLAATPPQLLKPIITSKGVHIILVKELIQPKLDDKLHHKIISDLFSEWLKQQIEKFEVEIALKPNSLGDFKLKHQLLAVSS